MNARPLLCAPLVGALLLGACGGSDTSPSTTTGYRSAVTLPSAFGHKLGTIDYRCAGSQVGLAVMVDPRGATESVRFTDTGGKLLLARNVNPGQVARAPLGSARQTVEVILAIEPGKAIAHAAIAVSPNDCKVARHQVRVARSSNALPSSSG